MTSGRTISSGQDSVTKTGFNLMFETTKDWKKNYVYERMAFKTKDISQQKNREPWDMGYKWGEPWYCPAAVLRECLGVGAGRGNQTGSAALPGLKRLNSWVQRHRWQSTREKRAKQTKTELLGFTEGLPWIFNRVLTNKYMGGKSQRSGKDHLKELVGTAPVPHKELEVVTAPTSQSRPSHNSHGTVKTAEENLVSVMKII